MTVLACFFSIFLGFELSGASLLDLSGKSAEEAKRALSNATVIAFITMNCDIGSYANELFFQSMEPCSNVSATVIEYPKAQEIFNRGFRPGEMLVIHNGRIIESSRDTQYGVSQTAGFNQKQHWVYQVFKRHNLPLPLAKPDALFLPPQADTGRINLSRGLIAEYLFDGSPNESQGRQNPFTLMGSDTIRDGALSCDGVYNSSRFSGGYFTPKEGASAFDNGVTIHANISLARSDKGRRLVFGFGYSILVLELSNGALDLVADLSGQNTARQYRYSLDVYPLHSIPFTQEQWHSVIISTDFTSRRVKLMFDGKRQEDLYLTQRFVDHLKQFGLSRLGCYGIRLSQPGWGGVFHGQADDIAIYSRVVNGAEMRALYEKYRK